MNERAFDYKPRVCVRCPECGVEHRGKCHFLRRSPRAKHKPSVEEIRGFIQAAKQRRLDAHVRRLIKELNDGIEKGRRSARRANRLPAPAKDALARTDRANLGLTKPDQET